MFKNPFSFSGRIRRLEYGLSILIYLFVLYSVVFLLASIVDDEDTALGMYLMMLIPLLWFTWAQGAKRCHDLGNSGFYQLIPFYGLWMLFEDGKKGPNKYGPNPKGKGNLDSIEEIGKPVG